MANYTVQVRSPKAPADAFAYMADLRNFAEWDPGVTEVEQIDGDGAGPQSVFDVTVKGFTGPMRLRYETIQYTPPTTVVARAESSVLTSLDTVTVRADGDGSVVTYAAELSLKGILKLGDPLLGIMFDKIGDRAARGLVSALDGERVSNSKSSA